MDANYSAIKSLYQEEINAHKRHIEELKLNKKHAEESNNSLVKKVHDLNILLDKAHVANQDLHTAFEHIREENQKLLRQQQLQIDNRSPENHQVANVDSANDELALEQARNKCVALARESVSWVSDKDRMNQRLKFLERECERYNRDNCTLGKQVRHLLKALEEERGMIIRREKDIHESEKPNTVLEVIDQHLVTFESIEELQQQNQKLLSLVKDITKEQEEKEINFENEAIQSLNGEIKDLKERLESVKKDRESIMNVFNTMHKERDLFKILLYKTREVEHMTPEIFQKMVSVACSSGPAITNEPEDTQDKDAHIADLKAMIVKLEQDLSELKAEFEDARNNSDKEINLKTDLLEQAHLKILAESQQASEFKERNQILEENIKSLTTEFEEGRAKCQKLTFEVEQLTEAKKHLTNELEIEKRTRQTQFESIINDVKAKCELNYETKLKLVQIESENKELLHRIENLETINDQYQAELKRLEEEKEQLQSQSDAIKEEIEANVANVLRDKETHIADLEATISRFELEFSSSKNELDAIKSNYEAQVERKNQMLEALQSKVKSISQQAMVDKEKYMSEKVVQGACNECTAAKSSLSKNESEIRGLKNSIKNLEMNKEKYLQDLKKVQEEKEKLQMQYNDLRIKHNDIDKHVIDKSARIALLEDAIQKFEVELSLLKVIQDLVGQYTIIPAEVLPKKPEQQTLVEETHTPKEVSPDVETKRPRPIESQIPPPGAISLKRRRI